MSKNEKQLKQFDGQRDDEHVVALFRKHWTIIGWVIIRLLLILALLIWLIVLASDQLRVFLLIAIGLVLIWGGRQFILWYYSFYILTDQRLRYTQRFGLSQSSLLDLPLSSIKVVRYFSKGLLSEMLNYGDIVIEADGGELTMTKLSRAKDIYNQIQDLINQNGESDENI